MEAPVETRGVLFAHEKNNPDTRLLEEAEYDDVREKEELTQAVAQLEANLDSPEITVTQDEPVKKLELNVELPVEDKTPVVEQSTEAVKIETAEIKPESNSVATETENADPAAIKALQATETVPTPEPPQTPEHEIETKIEINKTPAELPATEQPVVEPAPPEELPVIETEQEKPLETFEEIGNKIIEAWAKYNEIKVSEEGLSDAEKSQRRLDQVMAADKLAQEIINLGEQKPEEDIYTPTIQALYKSSISLSFKEAEKLKGIEGKLNIQVPDDNKEGGLIRNLEEVIKKAESADMETLKYFFADVAEDLLDKKEYLESQTK